MGGVLLLQGVSKKDLAGHKARCKKARATVSQFDTGEAIHGLPNHLVVAHILRSEYFGDPIVLARLRALSTAMCFRVAAPRFWPRAPR